MEWIASCLSGAWREQYPGKPVTKMLETYEIGEYGRSLVEEDFELLIGD